MDRTCVRRFSYFKTRYRNPLEGVKYSAPLARTLNCGAPSRTAHIRSRTTNGPLKNGEIEHSYSECSSSVCYLSLREKTTVCKFYTKIWFIPRCVSTSSASHNAKLVKAKIFFTQCTLQAILAKEAMITYQLWTYSHVMLYNREQSGYTILCVPVLHTHACLLVFLPAQDSIPVRNLVVTHSIQPAPMLYISLSIHV